MANDSATAGSAGGAADWRRRRQAVLAGHRGDEAGARAFLTDPSSGVRASALGALARLGAVTESDVARAAVDPDPAVRRRACEVAVGLELDLLPLLADRDPSVAETAAWALGERGGAGAGSGGAAPPRPAPGVVEALAAMATGHHDPLCREAAVAALGAVGDQGGLAAILAATKDKPAVRRRAVIALAPFEGPDVQAALERARVDRDWQVRQAAEDLMAGGEGADHDGVESP
ncbi:MAG TPA: HEAT repeat domain-containing protein [Acidimicrobiales bacterium]|nr:HEAT repeat domain-containing protein [Acidimicrobiales bacterium]